MSDLIGEIQANRRKRATQQIILLVVVVILVAVSAFVAKIVWDRHRAQVAVQQAVEHLRQGTRGALSMADESLAPAIDLRPDDTNTVAAQALVAGHRALLSGSADAPEEAGRLEAARSLAASEASSSLALDRIAAGDLAAAREHIADAGDQTTLDLAPAHPEWLLGLLGQAQVFDGKAVSTGLDAVTRAQTLDPRWADYHRTALALRFQRAEIDQVFAGIEAARESFPGHLGFAADEALYSAVLRRNLEGVATVTEQVLANDEELTVMDRGRALLARAIARLAQAEAAAPDLAAAWSALPEWDLATREIAIEFALARTREDEPLAWLESLEVPPAGRGLYDAWLALARGQPQLTLERLAQHSGEQPRVAYLTALALVEHRQWSEAGPWLERAAAKVPARLELEVAKARVDARDPSSRQAALERLTALAEQKLTVTRLWTALGEAHLERSRDKDVARKDRRTERAAAIAAFERALDSERMPAEAALRLAMLHQEDGPKSAEEVDKVLGLYERAATINAAVSRYKLQLAHYLIHLGFYDRAEDALRDLAQRDGAAGTTMLLLADVLIQRAQTKGNVEEQAKEIEQWIQRATSASATERGQVLARLDLARNTAESLARAKTTLEALLAEDRGDLEARILHVKTLIAQGDLEGAQASIDLGTRQTPVRRRGRLYLLEAQLDLRGGNERRAARRAWSGWRRVTAEQRPARELLADAQFTSGLWLAIRQESGAAKVAQELTDRAPHLPEAWVLRSQIELAGKQPQQACESAKAGLDRDPQWAAAHAALGDCLGRLGNRAEARDAYTKAIELAEDTPDAARYRQAMRRL